MEDGRAEMWMWGRLLSSLPPSRKHQHLLEVALPASPCSAMQHPPPFRQRLTAQSWGWGTPSPHNYSGEAEEGAWQGSHLALQLSWDVLWASCHPWMEAEGRQTLGGRTGQAALTLCSVGILLLFRRTLLSTARTEHKDPGAAMRFSLTCEPGTSSMCENSSATCKRRQGLGS